MFARYTKRILVFRKETTPNFNRKKKYKIKYKNCTRSESEKPTTTSKNFLTQTRKKHQSLHYSKASKQKKTARPTRARRGQCTAHTIPYLSTNSLRKFGTTKSGTDATSPDRNGNHMLVSNAFSSRNNIPIDRHETRSCTGESQSSSGDSHVSDTRFVRSVDLRPWHVRALSRGVNDGQ